MYSQVHSSDNLSPLFNLVKKKVMSVPNKCILACFFINDNFCRSRLKKYQAHRLPEITQTFVSCLPSSVVFLDFIITKVDAFHGCGWSLCFDTNSGQQIIIGDFNICKVDLFKFVHHKSCFWSLGLIKTRVMSITKAAKKTVHKFYCFCVSALIVWRHLLRFLQNFLSMRITLVLQISEGHFLCCSISQTLWNHSTNRYYFFKIAKFHQLFFEEKLLVIWFFQKNSTNAKEKNAPISWIC